MSKQNTRLDHLMDRIKNHRLGVAIIILVGLITFLEAILSLFEAIPEESSAVVVANIELPTYVVLDQTHEDFNDAQQRLIELVQQNFSAIGYYWVPVFEPNGPPLFQVYLGPFKSRDTALQQLCRYNQLHSNSAVIRLTESGIDKKKYLCKQ